MGTLSGIFTVLALANVVLLLPILYVYIKNYKATHSNFSFSLVVFCGLFLVENLIDLLFLFSGAAESYYGFLGFHQAGINVLELVGILVLFRLTLK